MVGAVSTELALLGRLKERGLLTERQYEEAKATAISRGKGADAKPSPPRTEVTTRRVFPPRCSGGHGGLLRQASWTVPEQWKGRLRCSECNLEAAASEFVGCRRCDYDLCPPCARQHTREFVFSQPLPPRSRTVSPLHRKLHSPSPVRQPKGRGDSVVRGSTKTVRGTQVPRRGGEGGRLRSASSSRQVTRSTRRGRSGGRSEGGDGGNSGPRGKERVRGKKERRPWRSP
eukprot:Sspe_Gene.111940::Locus_94125_Transcript_2_3_Confidence_0.200_Length_751::g.111940::m.111940